jgi:ATP-dependent helicase/DNAse subunit B
VPREFELRFGAPEDPLGPAELADGELRLQGRIDRIDVSADGGEAIVYDYKGKAAPPQARWIEDANLQVGLYLLALPQLLGLQAVGGLYQPLGRDDDGRPRGLLLDGADPGLTSVSKDRLSAEEFQALLQEVLDAALQAVRGIRSGALVPDPSSCAYRGGCAHPTICRCEAASA